MLMPKPSELKKKNTELSAVLENGAAIAPDEELCGASFGQLSVAGMGVHALDDAVHRVIEIVAGNLILEVFRHIALPCIRHPLPKSS